MIKCPYCRTDHIDTFLCRHAKQAGIAKADLPDAYYIDTNTGECPPPRGKETGQEIPNENLQESANNSETDTKRSWRERNREHYNAYMREWKERNKDSVREYQREYMRRRRKARQE